MEDQVYQLHHSISLLGDSLVGIKEIMGKKLTEQKQLLHTLIQGPHDLPSLVVMFPVPAASSGLGRLNPMNAVQDRFVLMLVCAHSLQLVPCGPEGHGYGITESKEW